ncbi:response regulator transcription factor [Pedobacter xixiisoli]|uniref:Two component transcriptional regulator, LuxR family n=1 Tax=Pedobacter xixiisoli TaxID=1476464 RepID=A0A285ZWG5_9SPHI|nr:response regulator transcription factor [Pedobacter xixiisoli]SOD13976.1 two component transcriptional regulator, LuxR family [Pedobacter xixiisoli]
MVNIILADQQQLVRSGLKTLLLGTSDDTHVIETSTFEEALDLLPQTNAQFLITDMSAENGPEIIQRALGIVPSLKVLVLSDQFDLGLVHRTFAHGASAFLLKECLYEELLVAMKCASAGRQYLCSGISSRLLESSRDCTDIKAPPIDRKIFTERELEILALIAEGRTNLEMSEQLFLSKRTVEGHRQSLLDKTKSRNTAQLITFAVRNHIIY